MRVWARKEAENQTEFGMESSLSAMNYLENYLDIPYNLPKQGSIMQQLRTTFV